MNKEMKNQFKARLKEAAEEKNIVRFALLAKQMNKTTSIPLQLAIVCDNLKEVRGY